MKSTLLHKQIRVAKFNSKLATALVSHDLRLQSKEEIEQNTITSKAHLNKYTFKGKEIKTENDRKQVLSYVNSLYENDNKNFDSAKFRKTKFKLKKWIENDKTPEEEKNLYRKLLKIADQHQNRSISPQNAIETLLKTSTKISRLNDKKRTIEALIELHNQKIDMNIDSDSQLNTRVISTLFKIPSHNQTPLSGEEQEEILNGYYETNFPNYEIIYSAVHNDETLGHAHNMINGKNQITQKYDFVEAQYQYILNKIELPGFPGKYSKCSAKQIKLFGELIQQDFYDFANSKVESKNIIFEKKQYNSKEEKALEREQIKTDTSKRVANREYNTATYLAEEKQKNSNDVKALITQKSELKNDISKIENAIRNTIDFAAEYAATAVKRALVNFKNEIGLLNKLSEFVAKNIGNQAKDMQPNQDQKDKIENAVKEATTTKYKS